MRSSIPDRYLPLKVRGLGIDGLTLTIDVTTSAALLLLILLIDFILQNTTKVEVRFLGLSGTLPLGMALLIAAGSGGVLVAIAGVARVAQLRINARRIRRSTSSA